MDVFRAVPPKREQWTCGATLARHRHREGYVTLVLSGEYTEAGDYGRRLAMAGDIMFHGAFEAHSNRMEASKTDLFSMALPLDFRPIAPHASIDDLDAVVITAERDPVQALQMITEKMQPTNKTVEDWPDSLAGAIIAGGVISFRAWADQNQLHPASLARGFRQIYGAAPCRYRLELRSKEAWKLITDTDQPLGMIAHQLDFSDQAHMSRCVKQLTGQSPGQWRRLKSFKTAAARRALLME